MEEVIYLWSATREGKVAEEFLSGFNGVLVSDFYSAYDSISCAQQKCLIHLIRDLNEDVLKEPFNEEMKTLVHEFAELLKPIIETIDRFGLKSHFLKRVCLFCDDGPLAGRMKPDLVLGDVKRPIVIEVSAEVKGSQFDDGFCH